MNECCVESSVESTPSFNLDEMFGYTTNGQNFPGLISLVFRQVGIVLLSTWNNPTVRKR